MLSAEGSHSSSPRRSAAVSISAMAALISPRRAAADVAVEGQEKREGEAMGPVERPAVDALRIVLWAVVMRWEDGPVGETGDRGGAQLRDPRRQRVRRERASRRLVTEPVAVLAIGLGDGRAELRE